MVWLLKHLHLNDKQTKLAVKQIVRDCTDNEFRMKEMKQWRNIYIEKYARMNSSKAWMHEKRNTKLVVGLCEWWMEGCTETVNDWNDIPLLWAWRIAIRQSSTYESTSKAQKKWSWTCLVFKNYSASLPRQICGNLLLTLRLGNQGGSSQLHCPHQQSSSVLFDTAIRRQSVTRLWRRLSIKRLYFTCGKVVQLHICWNAAMHAALLLSKACDTGLTNVS